MPKRTGSTPTFTYLVANLAEGSDPSKGRNPVKVRSVFEQQFFPQTGRPGDGPDTVTSQDKPGVSTLVGRVDFTVEGVPTASAATVTVDSNTFAFPATLFIGGFTITNGVDYTVGASAGDTATAIATAISNLPGFSASPSGTDVDITGPAGPTPIRFEVLGTNFTLVPDAGVMTPGEPLIGPPVIS